MCSGQTRELSVLASAGSPPWMRRPVNGKVTDFGQGQHFVLTRAIVMGYNPSMADSGGVTRTQAPPGLPPEVLDRSLALVCRNMFNEHSDLLSMGRFKLVRTIGRGANGIVYEAFDPLRGEHVALKTILGSSARHLFRLKREFRCVADIRHPNLVSLHELSVVDGAAYFTMELVRGQDISSHARECLAGVPASERRRQLRATLFQLALGIDFLHRSETLHGDLKPSNVMVTADGRVVILDFGLARGTHDARLSRAGTAGYVAPEQARGRVGMASDWYSFGRVIQEVLRHAGGAFVEGWLRRLHRLASQLTDPDPRARPGFADVAGLLAPEGAREPSLADVEPLAAGQLTGRDRELERLRAVLAASRSGPVMCVLEGESGIGKTALLDGFSRIAETHFDAVVLRGCGYERESVPYQAFDRVVDDLAAYLQRLPAGRRPSALAEPSARAALTQVFPALSVMCGPDEEIKSADLSQPVALRTRAVALLRAVFAELAQEHALVICIDDLHWSDDDSGVVLGDLLGRHGAPPMLVLVGTRPVADIGGPALRELRARLSRSPQRVPWVAMPLGPLREGDALALAATLSSGLLDSSLARAIAVASTGHPLWLHELARWCLSHAGQRPRTRLCTGPAGLTELLAERIATAPAAVRGLLRALACAGQPLPMGVLTRVQSGAEELVAGLAELQARHLVRVRFRRDGKTLELAHSTLADAVRSTLTADEQLACHRQLAQALEQEGQGGELLVEQYLAGQMPDAAARCALRVAEEAMATLAFARAAHLFEVSLRVGSWSAEEQVQIHSRHALALELAGRGLGAAQALELAADVCADGQAAARLRQRAAGRFMHNGDQRRAAQLLASAYHALGLHWPSSRHRLVLAIAGLLWRRLWPWPDRAVAPALRRARAELLAEAGHGMETYDALRALHNALLCFHEAERIPDPVWRVRMRAGRALVRCGMLPARWETKALADLRAASTEVVQLGDRPAEAAVFTQLALAALLCGFPREALTAAEYGELCLRAEPHQGSSLSSVMGIVATALLELGELRELRERWDNHARESRVREDGVTTIWVHAQPIQFALLFADDDRAGAEHMLRVQAGFGGRYPESKGIAWAHALCQVEVALYCGRTQEALALVNRKRASLFGSGFRILTDMAQAVVARTLVAAAADEPSAHVRAVLLRKATLGVGHTRRHASPLRRASGLVIRAGVAALSDDSEAALRYLTDAATLYHEAQSKLGAACADFQRGALLSGHAGDELQRSAIATLRGEGIVDVDRWMAWSLGGFRASCRDA